MHKSMTNDGKAGEIKRQIADVRARFGLERGLRHQPPQMSNVNSTRELFQQLDSDNSGYIEAAELDTYLSMLGISDSEIRRRQVPALLERMDLDGDGRVSYEEFKAVAKDMGIVSPPSGSPSESPSGSSVKLRKKGGRDRADDKAKRASLAMDASHALEMFDEIDVNRDCRIDVEELVGVLNRLGIDEPSHRRKHAEHIFSLLDLDGDGVITRAEFHRACHSGMLENILLSSINVSDESSSASKSDDDDDGHAYDNMDELIASPDHMMPPSRVSRHSSNTSVRAMPPVSERVRELVPEDRQRRLWQLFRAADVDGDGTIGSAELRNILRDKHVMGLTLTDEEATRMTEAVMGQLDASGDGVLDFDEFCIAFSDLLANESDGAAPTAMSAGAQALANENKALTQRVEQLQSDWIELEAKHQVEVDTLRNQLQHTQEDADSEYEKAQEQIRALENANSLLKRELDIYKQEQDLRNGTERETLVHAAAPAGDSMAGSGSKDEELDKLKVAFSQLLDEKEKTDIELSELKEAFEAADKEHDDHLRELLAHLTDLKGENERFQEMIAELRRSQGSAADSGGESMDVAEMQKKLKFQQALAFDLTSERDRLNDEVERLKKQLDSASTEVAVQSEEALKASSTTGQTSDKGEVESLNSKLVEAYGEIAKLRQRVQELESGEVEAEQASQTAAGDVSELNMTMDELRSMVEDNEMERTRLEEERRDVTEMRQEMEALQAMVVAQTAQLTLKQEAESRTLAMENELMLQRDLLKKAEDRAEGLLLEREQLMADLEVARMHMKLQSDEIEVIRTQLDSKALVPSDIQTLEKENQNLKAQLRNKSKAKGAGNPATVKKIKKTLADALAEVARLSVQMDEMRDGYSQLSAELTSARAQLKHQQDGDANRLNERNQLLQRAQRAEADARSLSDTIKMMREQACVQVEVKKEVMHTREHEGEMVPVNRSEETETVTWFTDEQTKSLRMGPWTATEDRILIQGQLAVGDNWIELAKMLPGRTDKSIAERWEQIAEESEAPMLSARNVDDLAAHDESMSGHSLLNAGTDRDQSQRGHSPLQRHEVTVTHPDTANASMLANRSYEQGLMAGISMQFSADASITSQSDSRQREAERRGTSELIETSSSPSPPPRNLSKPAQLDRQRSEHIYAVPDELNEAPDVPSTLGQKALAYAKNRSKQLQEKSSMTALV